MESRLRKRQRKAGPARTACAMAATGGLLLTLAGCHTDMWDQPKVHKPLQPSEFFTDGNASRPLVVGTVARNPQDVPGMRVGNPFFTGIGADGRLLDALPAEVPLTRANLKRGQERFEIFCTPCHGRIGDGKGMIAVRGLALRKQPGNYHTPRMRQMPIGHFYDVITNGFGAMYSYSSRIEPADRWRIAAYVRVLQASQNVPASQLPAEVQADLAKPQAASPEHGAATTPGSGGTPGAAATQEGAQ